MDFAYIASQRALGAPSLHLMQMHVANDYSSPFTGTSSLKPSNKKQVRRWSLMPLEWLLIRSFTSTQSM